MKGEQKFSLISALALLLLAFYSSYSCYKFFRLGIFEHTVLVFLFCWLLGFTLLLLSAYKIRGKIAVSVFLLLGSVWVSILIAELFLRSIHKNESSIETRSGIYVSPYHSNCTSLFLEYSRNETFYLESPEYRYKRTTNSLGITGPEPMLKKDSGEFRILAMGDSYTDGDGADYDSSYVKFLERNLRAKYPCQKFSFINAGVCGSDPVFNYTHLEKKFVDYHPDLVLVNIASGDIMVDEMIRGGMERFANGQKATYRKGPSWEPVYAVSFLFRLLANRFKQIDLLLLTPQDYVAQKHYLDFITTDVMQRFDKLGEQNNFRTIFTLRPFLWEIKKGIYDYNFDVLQQKARGCKNLQWFDMLPEYKNLIKASGKPADYFFWPQNGHHNAAGYELMGAITLAYTETCLLRCANDNTPLSEGTHK
jgi:hypothetical protein